MKTSKTLSPKQKKIAKMAGDPNKIEGEDFKKLKPMKANEGVGIDKARKHKQFVKEKLDTAKGYAKEMLGISSADRLTQKDYELMRDKTAEITAKDRLTPEDYELMKEKRKMHNKGFSDAEISAMGKKAGGSAIKGKGAVARDRGMGLQDENISVGKGADYIKDLI
jgi:hypothetical protein